MLHLLIILFFSVSFAWGQNYSTHTVKSGDTLWEIAVGYGTTIAELQHLNSLQSTTISVGQQLYLPVETGGASIVENAAVLAGYPNSFKVHVVNQGESLFSLSRRYNLNEETLRSANPELVGNPVQGAFLRIPPRTGRIVTLQTNESLLSLSLRYNLAPSELAKSNDIEDTKVLQGRKIFIPMVLSASVAPQGSSVSTGQSRREMLQTQQLRLLQKAPSLLASYRQIESKQQSYAWPLNIRGRLTSYFGRRDLVINGSNFHAGIDIAAATGTPILATKGGVVAKAGWLGGYGYAIYVNHDDGTQTRYAHMSQILVSQSQRVRQGEQLGLVGSTGISTGPHLHFELRVNGYAVNPLDYLGN